MSTTLQELAEAVRTAFGNMRGACPHYRGEGDKHLCSHEDGPVDGGCYIDECPILLGFADPKEATTPRALTELEAQFVKEAEAGGFYHGHDPDGVPWALGEAGKGHLFSMPTVEYPYDEKGNALYYIKDTASGYPEW